MGAPENPGMMPVDIERTRQRLAECRAIVGGSHDPLAASWREMDERERQFWLRLSKLPAGHRYQSEFSRLPGDVRTSLKNNLYRAAKRAELILSGGVAV